MNADRKPPWWEYAIVIVAYIALALAVSMLPIFQPVWFLAAVPWLLAIFNAQWAWQARKNR